MPSRRKNRVKNPDGTRSKGPAIPPTIKRKEVEDGDGWIRVIGPHQHKIRDSIETNVVHIARSLDDMSAQHARTLKRWQESDASGILSTTVLAIERNPRIRIKRIVCLGLGTLQNGNLTQQNNRHAQLAALMDLVGMFGGLGQVTALAQDPAFGPCDQAFLLALGFQVVEDPRAFEAIDGETLVYAVHCHEDIYERVTKSERPAILIGNDVEELCNSREPSMCLQLFAREYEESCSVEPVLSKRKARTDHFDQIFYSALYATRLYLRKEAGAHMPLPPYEGSSVDVEKGELTSEERPPQEIEPRPDHLAVAGAFSPEESIAPTRPVPRENFTIFEDHKRLGEEVVLPMREGDPTIENKENIPPDESDATAMDLPTEEDRRQSRDMFPHQLSPAHFSPGLRLSALPNFDPRNHEGLGFPVSRAFAPAR